MDELKDFKNSADFIGNADNQGLAAARQPPCQRPHVFENDVFFLLCQIEMLLCVFKRRPRMGVAVPAVRLVGDVPVVEEEVVKQRPAHQRRLVAFYAHQPEKGVAVKRDGEAVFQAGGSAVVDETVHPSEWLKFQKRFDAFDEKVNINEFGVCKVHVLHCSPSGLQDFRCRLLYRTGTLYSIVLVKINVTCI